MRFILLITLVFSSTRIAAHEVPIAFFNIDIDKNTMHLMIQFDTEDLDYAASSFYGELIGETKTNHASWISKYLKKHFSISLNRNDISTHIQDVKQEGDHYFITFTSTCLDEAIKSIEVKNECLIHEIDQHSNIIRLNQTGAEERGFRLHKGRISTLIQL